MLRPQSRLCVYPLVVPSCEFRRKDGLPRETRGRNTHDHSSAERSPCPRRRQSPTKSRRGKVTKVLHPVWQQDINASTSCATPWLPPSRSLTMPRSNSQHGPLWGSLDFHREPLRPMGTAWSPSAGGNEVIVADAEHPATSRSRWITLTWKNGSVNWT